MRDLLGLSILTGLCGVALFHPWIGIIGWTYISIMNPHRFSWAVSVMPVAAVVAMATLVGMVLSRDRVRPFLTPTLAVFILFALWMCVTLPFSMSFDLSYELWSRAMKIDFMILVAATLLYTRKHMMALVWALVISLGLYGVKGGIFTIVTSGDFRVWGPEGSYIEGNNELALALVISIPLMRFLQLQYRSAWIRYGLGAMMILSATAALGTQSRGALLAIVAMAIVLWSRTRHKVTAGIVMVLIGIALVAFMPGKWDTRMGTILTYQEDSSATGRINAWWMAYNLAKDNFFGGGFDIYTPEIFARYAPDPLDVHAAHSIYFQVLGEHGFVGLALFLLLWFMAWRDARWLRRNGSRHSESAWTSDLGAMIQASIVGYAVGGALPWTKATLSESSFVRSATWPGTPPIPIGASFFGSTRTRPASASSVPARATRSSWSTAGRRRARRPMSSRRTRRRSAKREARLPR